MSDLGRVVGDARKRDQHDADCGATFGHDPHPYRTERGKTKACDGSVTKRKENDR